jgi:hypothetical protein
LRRSIADVVGTGSDDRAWHMPGEVGTSLARARDRRQWIEQQG